MCGSLIYIHKKNFFYAKKIIALNDDEIVSFIDQAKIIRSIFAQIFWSYFYSMIQIHHRNNSLHRPALDRKSTRLNSSHQIISYAVFCLKKKNKKLPYTP